MCGVEGELEALQHQVGVSLRSEHFERLKSLELLLLLKVELFICLLVGALGVEVREVVNVDRRHPARGRVTLVGAVSSLIVLGQIREYGVLDDRKFALAEISVQQVLKLDVYAYFRSCA